jgi:hypothetical protein
MPHFAQQVEAMLSPRGGVVLDDRRLPLFRLGERRAQSQAGGLWRAEVVDEDLLAQGAPREVLVRVIRLAPMAPALLGRALEACLVDHPRILLVHSAAVPAAVLEALQPKEPSPLLPPLHWMPLADDAQALVVVQEWVETISVLEWRRRLGRELGLPSIMGVFETVSEALAALHRRGFAHGALVPESIGLEQVEGPTVEGQGDPRVWVAKLLDLGLTRLVTGPGDWPAGPEALWCAPEAFAPDTATDWRRADQLAVAALLFALWTDQMPFAPVDDRASPEARRDERRGQIEALPPPRGNQRAWALGVTPAMSAACMRAMSPDPADRFPSLDAFGAALRRASRENARRPRLSEMESGGGTQPGTYVGARFRALSSPPMIDAAPAPAAASARTDPGVRTGARSSRTAPASDEEDGAATDARATDPAVRLPAPSVRVREPAPPPDDDDDDDETPRPRDPPTRTYRELGLRPPEPWAFNRLAVLLVAAWVVSILAFVAARARRETGEEPLAPAPVAAAQVTPVAAPKPPPAPAVAPVAARPVFPPLEEPAPAAPKKRKKSRK